MTPSAHNSDHLARRDFLQVAAAGTLGTLAGLQAVTQVQAKGNTVNTNSIPVIDTHQHLWDLDKFNLPWMQGPAKEILGFNFLLPEYRAATAKVPIEQTVYMEVNVAADQQTQEAEYVFDLCQRDDNTMKGAVIGGSPQSAEFKAYVEQFVDNPFFKGVRTVLHDADRKQGMCLAAQFVENMKLLGKYDKMQTGFVGCLFNCLGFGLSLDLGVINLLGCGANSGGLTLGFLSSVRSAFAGIGHAQLFDELKILFGWQRWGE